jgi:cobaltochelatase CobT
LLARVPLGAPLPEAASDAMETRWESAVTPAVATALKAMARLLEDQQRYARLSLQVISTVIQAQESPQHFREHRDTPEQTDSTPLSSTSSTSDAIASSADRPHSDEPAYRVYTRQFDRISQAAELYDEVTADRRRRELDRHIGASLTTITRWAHRLQRRLLALQLRSWQFDRDEGVLDAARLARIATRPLEPLACKEEADCEFPDTVVTLLVDNSGSMRGAAIGMAAACAEILGRVLERCAVKTEILGYTTRSWEGGLARRKWVADGCPPGPGRIADLQHVIYKSADEPWRRSRRQLGLMLEDELLKENIDGAASRLLQRTELRRILIVICDGAPLEEATLAANGARFLDRHLRSVIEWLEHCAPLELLAIGVGHDVNAYYRRAVKLDRVEELGEALVKQLSELLASPRHHARRRLQRTQGGVRALRMTRRWEGA